MDSDLLPGSGAVFSLIGVCDLLPWSWVWLLLGEIELGWPFREELR